MNSIDFIFIEPNEKRFIAEECPGVDRTKINSIMMCFCINNDDRVQKKIYNRILMSPHLGIVARPSFPNPTLIRVAFDN